MMSTTNSIPAHDKPGLLNGKFILLALAITVVLCWLLLLVTNHFVKQSLAIQEQPLSYAARATWPTPPVKHATMEIPISNYAPSGPQAKWQTISLNLEATEDELVRHAATLAASDSFTDDATRDWLTSTLEQHPTLWYPRWLLGQWYALHGDTDEANTQFEQAYALAPAIVMIPYVDPANLPIADLTIGTVIIGVDQANGEQIDQTLRLVFPNMTTDEAGRLYLPVYHTLLRFAQLPEPSGYQCSYAEYLWFEFPGRVAQVRPAVLWKPDATSDKP